MSIEQIQNRVQVDRAAEKGLIVDGYVLFADGATINTESLLTLDTPVNAEPDALYAVTINNPSKVSDLTVEFLNLVTMDTPDNPLGVSKSSSLTTVTIPKTAAGLRDTHTKIIQGLFLGDSSKISVKNATALTANQSQTIAAVGGNPGSGTFKLSLPHATTGATVLSDPLNYNATTSAQVTAIEKLIADAGYTVSTDGSAIDVTASQQLPTTSIIAIEACGTTIVPLMTFVDVDLDANAYGVTQTTVGAIRVPIQIRKV